MGFTIFGHAMNWNFLFDPEYWAWLGILAIVSFCQNMAFTLVSRSRNSGDPHYHRWAAWGSNGIWLICYLMIWSKVWGAFESTNYVEMIPLFLVYVLATAEGSVFMMKILLKKEKGARRVGAQAQDQMKEQVQLLDKRVNDLYTALAKAATKE